MEGLRLPGYSNQYSTNSYLPKEKNTNKTKDWKVMKGTHLDQIRLVF